MAKTALIIVDAQYDFIEGGALAVQGGEAVVDAIAGLFRSHDSYLEKYTHIVTTQDWHIQPGDHFSVNPDFVDSWPVHCVAGTKGADLCMTLDTALKGWRYFVGYHDTDVKLVDVRKGMYNSAYSGFQGIDNTFTPLGDILAEDGVTDVDVCGLATDYCVKETAVDANLLGFKTTVLKDYSAGINAGVVEALYNGGFQKLGIAVA